MWISSSFTNNVGSHLIASNLLAEELAMQILS